MRLRRRALHFNDDPDRWGGGGNAADGNADYRRGVGANSAFEPLTDWNTRQGQYRLN